MCIVDAERSDVDRDAIHTARKPYKCDECGRDIPVGEKYVYAFMAYEGRGHTYHTCAHCRVGQEWLTHNCGGFMPHGLIEEMDEHAKEYPRLAWGLLKIKVGIRRKWRRFDGAGLMPLPTEPGIISVDEP